MQGVYETTTNNSESDRFGPTMTHPKTRTDHIGLYNNVWARILTAASLVFTPFVR